MGKIFLFATMLFALNANATLDDRTFCNGKIIHWNLYQIAFEPYSDTNSVGRLEFWMAFNKSGAVIPSTFWYGYDTYLSSVNVSIYALPDLTFLNTTFNKSKNSKGCYTQASIRGITTENGLNANSYEYNIRASGFISRGNSDPDSDADMFTLNNAIITYGGVTKWGSLSFTQIR